MAWHGLTWLRAHACALMHARSWLRCLACRCARLPAALLPRLAGELLAVKRIHFDNITRDELAAIEQEILLLQKLRHEHIVSYMAIDITDTNLNILMEFCPGSPPCPAPYHTY